MNDTIYEDIWQAFITGDHISQGSIWGGAGLALVVPIEDRAVLAQIKQIQTELAVSLPFDPHLPETLHITLYLLGNPPESSIPGPSDFLRRILAPVIAFPIELKRVNSFFRAPFFEVHEDGTLNNLLSRIQPGLTELGYSIPDYGPRGQVWHLTLGAYTAANRGVAARKLLSELRFRSAGSFMVSELRLVKTSAGLPYRMETLERFPLAGGKV
jgi:2'-5' RNA ligase